MNPVKFGSEGLVSGISTTACYINKRVSLIQSLLILSDGVSRGVSVTTDLTLSLCV